MAVFEPQVAKALCHNSLPIQERTVFDTTWEKMVMALITQMSITSIKFTFRFLTVVTAGQEIKSPSL